MTMTNRHKVIVVDEDTVATYATTKSRLDEVFMLTLAVNEIASKKRYISKQWRLASEKPSKNGFILLAFGECDPFMRISITTDKVLLAYYNDTPNNWPPVYFGNEQLVWVPVDELTLSEEESHRFELPF